MAPLGVAVLGCGEGAQRHHLPILARLHDAQVVAIADVDGARLDAAGTRCPHARRFGSWQEALDVAGVDAAVICLPSALHARAAIAALERGLHVYVEKPLALTTADAEDVVAARASAGTVGMVGLNYRFNALYRSARRIVESGRLGDPVASQSVFTIPAAELPPWKRSRSEGGGVLLDLGSHHVDLAAWLHGEPVVAVAASLRSRGGDDDTASLELLLASGLVVQSLLAYGSVSEERFEMYGTRGKLVVDRPRRQHPVVEPLAPRSRRLAAAATVVRDLRRATYVLEKRRTPGHEPSHVAALRAFSAAARARGPASPSLEDGLAVVRVLDAAERAARSGRFEQVATGARVAQSQAADG